MKRATNPFPPAIPPPSGPGKSTACGGVRDEGDPGWVATACPLSSGLLILEPATGTGGEMIAGVLICPMYVGKIPFDRTVDGGELAATIGTGVGHGAPSP